MPQTQPFVLYPSRLFTIADGRSWAPRHFTIAATTVMLLLPKAEDLMFGFWLGAMLTSVTCRLVIVFALPSSDAVKTTTHTLSPALDLAIAALLGLAAPALAKGEDQRCARGRPRITRPRSTRHRTGMLS